jgi:hypothetical protein
VSGEAGQDKRASTREGEDLEKVRWELLVANEISPSTADGFWELACGRARGRSEEACCISRWVLGTGMWALNQVVPK